jgi:hypothetical protein
VGHRHLDGDGSACATTRVHSSLKAGSPAPNSLPNDWPILISSFQAAVSADATSRRVVLPSLSTSRPSSLVVISNLHQRLWLDITPASDVKCCKARISPYFTNPKPASPISRCRQRGCHWQGFGLLYDAKYGGFNRVQLHARQLTVLIGKGLWPCEDLRCWGCVD